MNHKVLSGCQLCSVVADARDCLHRISGILLISDCHLDACLRKIRFDRNRLLHASRKASHTLDGNYCVADPAVVCIDQRIVGIFLKCCSVQHNTDLIVKRDVLIADCNVRLSGIHIIFEPQFIRNGNLGVRNVCADLKGLLHASRVIADSLENDNRVGANAVVLLISTNIIRTHDKFCSVIVQLRLRCCRSVHQRLRFDRSDLKAVCRCISAIANTCKCDRKGRASRSCKVRTVLCRCRQRHGSAAGMIRPVGYRVIRRADLLSVISKLHFRLYRTSGILCLITSIGHSADRELYAAVRKISRCNRKSLLPYTDVSSQTFHAYRCGSRVDIIRICHGIVRIFYQLFVALDPCYRHLRLKCTSVINILCAVGECRAADRKFGLVCDELANSEFCRLASGKVAGSGHCHRCGSGSFVVRVSHRVIVDRA